MFQWSNSNNNGEGEKPKALDVEMNSNVEEENDQIEYTDSQYYVNTINDDTSNNRDTNNHTPAIEKMESSREGDKFTEDERLNLEKLLYKIRKLALIIIIISVFFLGWSILSFFIFPPFLGLFGLVVFTLSLLAGSYLLSDTIVRVALRERVYILLLFILVAIYFIIGVATGRTEGDYGDLTYSLVLICFLIWMGCGTVLQVWLKKLQTLTTIPVDYEVEVKAQEEQVDVNKGVLR